MTTLNINDTIDHQSKLMLCKSSRDFSNMKDLVALMYKNPIVWSWGPNKWSNFCDKILSFKVAGRIHKGYVYIVVNGSDLFDIYYTNKKLLIIKSCNDIYLEDLINTLDINIETII